MTEEELCIKYLKEHSNLIKKYQLKGDMKTYSEKLEQLKEKYIGTPIESFEDMEKS